MNTLLAAGYFTLLFAQNITNSGIYSDVECNNCRVSDVTITGLKTPIVFDIGVESEKGWRAGYWHMSDPANFFDTSGDFVYVGKTWRFK